MSFIDFNKHIDHLLSSEGGLVDDAVDRGGLTKYGISKAAFPDVDIKNLTVSDAKALYYKYYWIKGRCGDLPVYLRYMHFDACVNHGISAAVKLLQKGIGTVKVDGDFGPTTFSECHKCSLADYTAQRALFYAKIVKNDPAQLKFLVGWNNRLVNVAKVKL